MNVKRDSFLLGHDPAIWFIIVKTILCFPFKHSLLENPEIRIQSL